jgi:hypothetical protein
MQDLTPQVIEADERARAGRITRLRVLQDAHPLGGVPCDALAAMYFEEASRDIWAESDMGLPAGCAMLPT